VTDDIDDTVIVLPVTTSIPAAPAMPDTDLTVIVSRDPDQSHPEGGATLTPPDMVRDTRAAAGFYSFRVGAFGPPIPLDVPCTVGRRPSLPRVPTSPPPTLLTVPSPLKEVSASHIELRQLGSTVVVTDLRSTNGSVVLIPGSIPRKLRQGESIVVSPGTLVDIGDDNVLHILPMQRLA